MADKKSHARENLFLHGNIQKTYESREGEENWLQSPIA